MSLTLAFGIHFSLPVLNTGNVKMQNFRMRLSHTCFLFGRQLMKGTVGKMGEKRTLTPFKVLQLFQNILIRFSAFASLESKKETEVL